MEIIDAHHVTGIQDWVILGFCSCSRNQGPSIFLYFRPSLSFSTCKKPSPPLASVSVPGRRKERSNKKR